MPKSPAPFDVDAAVTEYRVLIKQKQAAKTPKARSLADAKLAILRARWRAWNGGDDLHETAMCCWDGDDVDA